MSNARLGVKPWNNGVKLDKEKYPHAGHIKKHSEEARRKMRMNHKGMSGMKHSKETKEKMSKSQKKLKNPENKILYTTIRKIILERDSYTCQICGLKDEEIVEVDHTRPKSIWKDLELEYSNLLTLCPNCHKRKTLRDKKTIASINHMKKEIKEKFAYYFGNNKPQPPTPTPA